MQRAAIPHDAIELRPTRAEGGAFSGPVDKVTGGVVVAGTPSDAIGSIAGGWSEPIVVD
jgi:hypothetical protein